MKSVKIIILLFFVILNTCHSDEGTTVTKNNESLSVTILNRGDGSLDKYDWFLSINDEPVLFGNNNPLYQVSGYPLRPGANKLKIKKINPNVDIEKISWATQSKNGLFVKTNEDNRSEVVIAGEVVDHKMHKLNPEQDEKYVKKLVMHLSDLIEEKDKPGLVSLFGGVDLSEIIPADWLDKKITQRAKSAKDVHCIWGEHLVLVCFLKKNNEAEEYAPILSWEGGYKIRYMVFAKNESNSWGMCSDGKTYKLHFK